MANYDWSHQQVFAPGAWSPGAWLAGAWAPGAWNLQGATCSVAPAVTGSTTVGSTLSCTSGTWSSTNGVPSFAYQWMRGSAKIAGATSSSYIITTADPGNLVSCNVSATDTITTSTRMSNAVQL
jgi:hypothetical protein